MDKIEHFTAFVRTVEAGGFSAAGRLLSVSPSAVSKQISRLEDHLKVRLFNRTSRALRLTTEGEILYERAVEVLALMEATEATVMSGALIPKGGLRVHAPPTFATYQLASLTSAYLERYPQVEIEYVLGNEPIDLVSSGIDVDIRRGPLKDSSLVARKIATITWTVCSSPDYLARRGTPTKPYDLLRHDCINISHRPELSRWHFAGKHAPQLVQTASKITANSAEMLKQMAIAGCGIARLASFQVASEIATGQLIDLFPGHLYEAEGEGHFYAVYFRRKNLNARIRTFVDHLADSLLPQPVSDAGKE